MAVDFLVRHASELMGGEALGWLLAPVHRLAAVLYMHGPSFQVGSFHLGFWQGKDLTDVCSALTGVRSQLWADNEAACERIVAERFFGVYYLLYVVGLAWIGWRVAATVMSGVDGTRQVTLSLQSAEWAVLESVAVARALQSRPALRPPAAPEPEQPASPPPPG